MLLTEEEAKNKDCYQWIVEHGDIGKPYCQGSGCMAWRWGNKKTSCKPPDTIEPTGLYKEYIDNPEKFWKGYCGLAGRPE